MTKTLYLASAALTMMAAPAYAQDIDANLNFNNNIAASVVNNTSFNSNTNLFGTVTIGGNLEIDSAATAVSDSKQILTGNSVVLDDEDNDDDTAGTIVNTTNPLDVAASGNVGANVATGAFNSQANISTIAVATTDSPNADDGGWSKANTTTGQMLTGTFYGADTDDFFDLDEDSTYVENNASVGNIGGSGNIGVNAAAGAFNMQQNLMTLAVAADSSLADASAAVVQHSAGNVNMVENVFNTADAGIIRGAGNIAVNVAAGVGNQQHNSLTVAASGAFGGNGTGGMGAGGL